MTTLAWAILAVVLLAAVAGVVYYRYTHRPLLPPPLEPGGPMVMEALLTGGLINPGYFPSTYWPGYYWQDDYWPEYGTAEPPDVTPGTYVPVIIVRRRGRPGL